MDKAPNNQPTVTHTITAKCTQPLKYPLETFDKAIE